MKNLIIYLSLFMIVSIGCSIDDETPITEVSVDTLKNLDNDKTHIIKEFQKKQIVKETYDAFPIHKIISTTNADMETWFIKTKDLKSAINEIKNIENIPTLMTEPIGVGQGGNIDKQGPETHPPADDFFTIYP